MVLMPALRHVAAVRHTQDHAPHGGGHNPCSTYATACRFVASREHRRVCNVCTPYVGDRTPWDARSKRAVRRGKDDSGHRVSVVGGGRSPPRATKLSACEPSGHPRVKNLARKLKPHNVYFYMDFLESDRPDPIRNMSCGLTKLETRASSPGVAALTACGGASLRCWARPARSPQPPRAHRRPRSAGPSAGR